MLTTKPKPSNFSNMVEDILTNKKKEEIMHFMKVKQDFRLPVGDCKKQNKKTVSLNKLFSK